MKRIVSIFLLLVYTTASSGMVLNTHFCMGDFAGVSIVEKDSSDQCPKCGMEDMGCCHDVPQVLKIDNGDFTAPLSIQFDSPIDLPAQIEGCSQPIFYVDPSSNHCKYTVIDSGPPIYILHCVFRI